MKMINALSRPPGSDPTTYITGSAKTKKNIIPRARRYERPVVGSPVVGSPVVGSSVVGSLLVGSEALGSPVGVATPALESAAVEDTFPPLRSSLNASGV